MTQANVQPIPKARSLTLPSPALAAGLLATLIFVREVAQIVLHRDKLMTIGDDFHFYWEALARFRIDPNGLYLPASTMDLRGFLYPPPAISLFLPLAALSYGWAGATFRIMGLLALIGSVAILFRIFEANDIRVSTRDRLCLTIVALTFGATYTNTWYGQVNTFVLLDCLAFRLMLDRKRPILAGAILAAGAWLKVYPLFCLLFVLVWEHRTYDVRRMLLGFTAAAVGIVIVCLPFLPLSVYRIYFTDTLPAIPSRTFQNILNQSIQGAAARTLVPASDFVDWDKCAVSVVSPMWGRIVSGILALVAGLWLGWQAKRSPARRVLGFLGVLAIIPIISPLGWSYVFVLAAPLLLLAILKVPRTPVALAMLLTVCMLLFLPSTKEVARLARLPELVQHMFYDRYMLLTLLVGCWILWRGVDESPKKA